MSDNTFLVDLFVNYDCDPKNYPLCELLYDMLSTRVVNHYIHSDYAVAIMNRGLKCVISRSMSLDQLYTEASILKYYNIDDKAGNTISISQLIETKNNRRTLQKGITIFNDNIKQGFQFFQDVKMLSTPPTPKEVAELFRFTPGLKKQLIGEYIGSGDSFNREVLKEYVKTFDFTKQKLLDDLRMFLECFRLPGEAQQIDAIVQVFL